MGTQIFISFKFLSGIKSVKIHVLLPFFSLRPQRSFFAACFSDLQLQLPRAIRKSASLIFLTGVYLRRILMILSYQPERFRHNRQSCPLLQYWTFRANCPERREFFWINGKSKPNAPSRMHFWCCVPKSRSKKSRSGNLPPSQRSVKPPFISIIRIFTTFPSRSGKRCSPIF